MGASEGGRKQERLEELLGSRRNGAVAVRNVQRSWDRSAGNAAICFSSADTKPCLALQKAS